MTTRHYVPLTGSPDWAAGIVANRKLMLGEQRRSIGNASFRNDGAVGKVWVEGDAGGFSCIVTNFDEWYVDPVYQEDMFVEYYGILSGDYRWSMSHNKTGHDAQNIMFLENVYGVFMCFVPSKTFTITIQLCGVWVDVEVVDGHGVNIKSENGSTVFSYDAGPGFDISHLLGTHEPGISLNYDGNKMSIMFVKLGGENTFDLEGCSPVRGLLIDGWTYTDNGSVIQGAEWTTDPITHEVIQIPKWSVPSFSTAQANALLTEEAVAYLGAKLTVTSATHVVEIVFSGDDGTALSASATIHRGTNSKVIDGVTYFPDSRWIEELCDTGTETVAVREASIFSDEYAVVNESYIIHAGYSTSNGTDILGAAYPGKSDNLCFVTSVENDYCVNLPTGDPISGTQTVQSDICSDPDCKYLSLTGHIYRIGADGPFVVNGIDEGPVGALDEPYLRVIPNKKYNKYYVKSGEMDDVVLTQLRGGGLRARSVPQLQPTTSTIINSIFPGR